MTDIETMTIEQIEELEKQIADQKKKQNRKLEKAKVAYERRRDKMVDKVIKTVQKMHDNLSQFKDSLHKEFDEQEEELKAYGLIRSNSKGGFSITHTDGTMRITRRRDTEPYWDERSNKALDLIKDFLHDTVKKRDQDLFDILIGFLERNQQGELEYARVFHLLKHEGKFDDKRWVEGLRLLKEGYSVNLKGYGYEFKVKDESGKWETLVLNFSAL